MKQCFSNCIRYVASSTLGSYSIDPNTSGLFGASLRNMAALYQEVRCVGIKLQILPNLTVDVAASPTGALQTCVVFGHAPLRGSTPASFSEVCQLSNSVALSSGQSVKSVLRLTRKDLLGPMPVKWVHFDGSPSTDTDSQGRIWTVATGSESTTYVVNVLVWSAWEFRSPQPFDLFMRKLKLSLAEELKSSPEPNYEVVDDEEKGPPIGVAIPPDATASAAGPQQPLISAPCLTVGACAHSQQSVLCVKQAPRALPR